MVILSLGADIQVVRSDLRFRTPGDVGLPSIYGAGGQTLGRGPGFYSGVLELKGSDFNSENIRRQAELLLVLIRRADNSLRIPIKRPSGGTLAAATVLTITAAAITGGELTITASGAVAGLIAGDYVSMSSRLYMLTENMAAGAFSAEPLVLPTVGAAIIWESVHVIGKVDRQSDGLAAPHTADFSGPWSIPWDEDIG